MKQRIDENKTKQELVTQLNSFVSEAINGIVEQENACLLYTSDAADE